MQPIITKKTPKPLFDEEVASKHAELLGSDRKPIKVAMDLSINWLTIMSCFYGWYLFPNYFTRILLIFVVATRQHALTVLLHDGCHYLLFRNRKLNDLVSDLFCAFPFFILTTSGFRRSHLSHHRFLNTPRDPDWASKSKVNDWKFPKTRAEILKLFLKHMSGATLPDLFSGTSNYGDRKNIPTQRNKLRFVYIVLVLALVTFIDIWDSFMCLWIFNLLIGSTLIHRIRTVAEHQAVPDQHDLNMTRTIHCGFIERHIFAPHGINFHIEHHLYPTVPYYNLPRLSAELEKDPKYLENALRCGGYFIRRYPNLPTVWSQVCAD